jgi:hypothetical protein
MVRDLHFVPGGPVVEQLPDLRDWALIIDLGLVDFLLMLGGRD